MDLTPQPPGGMGALPDPPDARDWKAHPVLMAEAEEIQVTLPAYTSIASKMPKVYQQGHLGSCAPNAACALYEYEGERGGFPKTATPSRLQVYREARIDMWPSWENEDSGSSIRTSIKALAKGACPESVWPYDDGPEKFKLPPGPLCLEVSEQHQALEYYRLDESAPTITLHEVMMSLALGHPVGFGIEIFASFQPDPKTGIIPAPKEGERKWGGHAMVIVGYDFRKGRRLVLARNSWGEGWGGMEKTLWKIPVGRKLKGHAWLDADWVVTKGWDFWVLRAVEG